MEGRCSLFLFLQKGLTKLISFASNSFLLFTLQEGYPKLSANIAGDRKFDVYMGIDVFGRNTYGGGEWTVSNSFLFPFLNYC